MTSDICNCDVSLKTSDGLAAWNAMTRAFLAHGAETPIHLTALMDAEPDFAMAHAAKGLFCLMLGRREMVTVARDAHAKASQLALAGDTTLRERAWIDALGAWLTEQPGKAIAALEVALRSARHDTLTMKASQAIRFMIGDNTGMRRSVERTLASHGGHALEGYVLGCHAFTLEETGDYAAAERTGLMGLSMAGDDAWGLHAVAHVYDMTHDPDRGIALIDDNASAWTHCNNFRYHVWWHKALLHLDRGEIDVVLGLYDAKIRHDKTDDYRDFSNASSLLVRLELEGVNVGDRWAELADLAEARSADGCLVFADLHYMLALTGDQRSDAAARMTARVAHSASPLTEQSRVTAHPGVAASEGLAAFGEGRYDAAFTKLTAARDAMQSIGGSHAQRDVFERLTIDAGLRAGRLDCAEAILHQRIALRAGARDSFAETRLQTISEARRVADTMAAQ